MRWLLVTILILAVLVSTGYATGLYEAIAAGFNEPVTPTGTYIAGKNYGGLERKSLEDKLADLVDLTADEKLIIWVDDEDYYSRSLGELGFYVNPVVLVNEVFDRLPSGFGLRRINKRHSALRQGLTIPMPLHLDEKELHQFISEVKESTDRDVQEAFLDFENHCVSVDVQGLRVDVDATLAKIPTSLSGIGPIPIRAIIEKTNPHVTAADIEGIDPTEPLASYTTKFNPRKRGRSHNIGHLAAKFKGVVLKPGEQLSFNEISGPRIEETGFKPAPEYMYHRIIDGFGGGSCQVSTTLYNTALLSGMQIDERYPHSRVIKYVPYGRDATVNYDSQVDLKFTNSLKHSIVVWVRSDIKDGWVTFEIFGYPDDKREIEITNEYTRIWRDADKDEFIIDRTLAPGEEIEDDKGTHGIRVETWRHFIQPDGSRITEELFYDVIKPVSRIVRHNPDTGGMTVGSQSEEHEVLESTGYIEVYF